MRISDWSSDVCSSDLRSRPGPRSHRAASDQLHPDGADDDQRRARSSAPEGIRPLLARNDLLWSFPDHPDAAQAGDRAVRPDLLPVLRPGRSDDDGYRHAPRRARSEEHTSELQSLMRTSYAVFCLKKKKTITS